MIGVVPVMCIIFDDGTLESDTRRDVGVVLGSGGANERGLKVRDVNEKTTVVELAHSSRPVGRTPEVRLEEIQREGQ